MALRDGIGVKFSELRGNHEKNTGFDLRILSSAMATFQVEGALAWAPFPLPRDDTRISELANASLGG